MVNGYKAASRYFWNGVCTVTVYEPIKDPDTKITSCAEKVKYFHIPCHLSYSSSQESGAGNVSSLSQDVKLFVDTAFDIPAGSKITVTQNEVTEVYERSGQPAVYSEHQEIPLVLFKGWA